MGYRNYPRHPVPADGATLRDGTPARRFALSGWLTLCCGKTSPPLRRPECDCNPRYAVRVDVLNPRHDAKAAEAA